MVPIPTLQSPEWRLDTSADETFVADAGGVGREAVIRTRDLMEYTRVRAMAVGSRCYIAALSATEMEEIKSPDAARFFSSFTPLVPK